MQPFTASAATVLATGVTAALAVADAGRVAGARAVPAAERGAGPTAGRETGPLAARRTSCPAARNAAPSASGAAGSTASRVALASAASVAGTPTGGGASAAARCIARAAAASGAVSSTPRRARPAASCAARSAARRIAGGPTTGSAVSSAAGGASRAAGCRAAGAAACRASGVATARAVNARPPTKKNPLVRGDEKSRPHGPRLGHGLDRRLVDRVRGLRDDRDRRRRCGVVLDRHLFADVLAVALRQPDCDGAVCRVAPDQIAPRRRAALRLDRSDRCADPAPSSLLAEPALLARREAVRLEEDRSAAGDGRLHRGSLRRESAHRL